MTEEQHIKIVETTLQKWFDQETVYLHRVAEAIVLRVQARIEMEMEDREQGVVVDFDQLKKIKSSSAEVRGTSEQVAVDRTPLPPPPVHAESSLIIDPSSLESKTKKPIRLPARRKVNTSTHSPELVRDYIEKFAPPSIEVETDDRKNPVRLIRNIELQLGCDTVRLSYGPSDMAQPMPSTANLDGIPIDPMVVDTPVSVVIDCTDQTIDLNASLEEIRKLAKAMYKPRPDHIDSYTPRRSGPITFRLAKDKDDPNADPHVDTDVLINSKGREY